MYIYRAYDEAVRVNRYIKNAEKITYIYIYLSQCDNERNHRAVYVWGRENKTAIRQFYMVADEIFSACTYGYVLYTVTPPQRYFNTSHH